MTDSLTLTGSDLVDVIIALIDEVTLGAYTALLSPDVPALSAGIVDSLALAELVDAIQERFGVRLQLSELGYDIADTPRQIAVLVSSHQV